MQFRATTRISRLLVVIVLGCSVFPGCGKSAADVGEVEGTVLLDGKPLDGIQVTFLPDPGQNTVGPTAVGVTDNQGHYKLAAVTGNVAGVVVGFHKVTLRDLKNFQPPAGRGGRGPTEGSGTAPPRRIPSVFEDPGTTTLTREVKPGNQSINLEIPKQGAPIR